MVEGEDAGLCRGSQRLPRPQLKRLLERRCGHRSKAAERLQGRLLQLPTTSAAADALLLHSSGSACRQILRQSAIQYRWVRRQIPCRSPAVRMAPGAKYIRNIAETG